MTYLLRSSPAFQQADLLQEFDITIRNSMCSITNISEKLKTNLQVGKKDKK